MLGGFLSGLSNLGQVYAGYQREQEANLIQQMNRERLLEAQQARLQQADLGKLIGAGGFGPLQPMTTQPIPQPGVQQPGAFPSSQPGQVPSYPLAPPPTPTQLAAAGPLGLLGIPGGGPAPTPLLQTASAFGMGGGMSPFGPGQPMGGLAPTGVGVPPSVQGWKYNPAGTGPDETADAGGLTGLQWGPDVNMFTATLGRPDRGGIVQPAGGFGMPPGYERPAPSVGGGPDEYLRPPPTVPGTADTGGTAQVPGTADTSGRVSLPNVQNAVFGIESNYGRDPSAAVPNRAGAVGPMQVTPKDYPQYDADRLVNDPQYNYAAGNEIIAGLYRKYGGNPDLVAIGYNAGERMADAVRDGRMSVNALPDETKRYLVNMHRRLGLPPPPGLDSGVGSAYAGMNRSASPQEHGAGNYGAQALLAAYPQMPRIVSSFETANQLAQMINQRLPGASDEEKGGVFLKLFPMMSQAAKEDTAQQWDAYNARVHQLEYSATQEEKQREFDIRQRELREQHAATVGKGGQVWQDPKTGQSYWVVGGRVQLLEGLPSTAVRPSTAGTPAVQESIKLYEKLEADKLKGDEAAVRADQQAIDDWNRAQGRGMRMSGVAAARAGLKQEHPDWNEDQIQDALGEYKRLQSIDAGFGSGILGRNVVSLNTVAAHAQTVRKAFEDLDTGNIQRFNAVAQRIAVETGQEEPTDFATAYSIMSGEVVRLLTTTGGTEGDRNHFQSLLQAQFSKAQGRGSLKIFDEMIDARFKSLEQQYASVGGPEQQEMRRQRFRNQILSDDARALHARAAKAAEGGAAPGAGATTGAPGGGGPSPAEISRMSSEQLLQLQGQKLNPEQEAAVRKRINELAPPRAQ